MTATRPECVSSSVDGKLRVYTYRAHEFEIERNWLLWWCYSGVKIPKDPTADNWWDRSDYPWELLGIDHEAGWGSLTRRGILRKLRRAIDREIRDKVRRRQLDDGALFERPRP